MWEGTCVVVGAVRGCGGMCVVVGGGMHGCRGHAWLGRGHAWLGGMCGCRGMCMVAGGHVWLWGSCMLWGGMHVVREACVRYNEIWSMSGRYAFYWNAFL